MIYDLWFRVYSLCVYVVMWLCSYAVVRSCVYVVMWLCSYVVMRLCGYVVMRLCGYVVMWFMVCGLWFMVSGLGPEPGTSTAPSTRRVLSDWSPSRATVA
ncbi:hypothetical protein T484DRAFT_1650122 [Baffinella frigidus]|nr:hypothetical protein T484DRAFT_1650122 [Cryptophyta sp. CCMP2293]